MDGLATMPMPAPAQRIGASWCEECGYHLRGLPAGQPCPECGHVPPELDTRHASPHAGWSRSVCLGLVLLLLLTADAVCSILIQPFSADLGGTVAALNVPGPKLWAMPLLQRPIGNSPEMPGVVGTRMAMIGLLAVWLVTAPSVLDRVRRDEASRRMTRWGCVLLFGVAFGATMGSQGRWPSELESYRFLLVGAVELPAAALLYQYLRRLARHVPGRERRGTFDTLAWAVPLTIAGAAGILGYHWWTNGPPWPPPPWRLSMLIGGAYGTIAIVCGIAATAAVGSLAIAYFQLGFPLAGRWVTGGRYAVRGVGRLARRAASSPVDARRVGVAIGLALLLLLAIVGNDLVSWLSSRYGVGGNLPFVNYPGPKFWAAVALGADGGGTYWWNFLSRRTTFITFNLLAMWLITLPLEAPRGARRLRRWTRWLPTICVGAALAALHVFERNYPQGDLHANRRSELFATVTVLLELPATLILYAMLARLAEEFERPRLAREFRALGVVVLGMVGVSAATFVVSRWFLDAKYSVAVVTMAAVYGAVGVCSAAWAAGAVVRLVGALFARGAQRNRLASEAVHSHGSMVAV